MVTAIKIWYDAVNDIWHVTAIDGEEAEQDFADADFATALKGAFLYFKQFEGALNITVSFGMSLEDLQP